MSRPRALRVAALLLLAVLVPGVVASAELPRRKSGLWALSTEAVGQTAGAQMCIDQKTDDLARQLAGVGVTCTKQEVRREQDRYVIDSVCKFGESTATSRAVFTGSFDSRYDVDIVARYEPPLMGISEGRTTIHARWLSPCKPGQRAGDVVMPNGTTLNILDAPRAPKR